MGTRKMTFLIDSGFLYATLDKDDINHKRVIDAFSKISNEMILLPTIVIVEVAYLLQGKLGHREMRQFISTLDKSPLQFVSITQTDINRVYELLAQYSDAKLDFVDASITALAERLKIHRILTVDQRDFRMIRPQHCDFFEIIP